MPQQRKPNRLTDNGATNRITTITTTTAIKGTITLPFLKAPAGFIKGECHATAGATGRQPTSVVTAKVTTQLSHVQGESQSQKVITHQTP